MNDISEERPEFFEGEYLGADDLQQIVVHMRDQSARHALAGHAWGIAAGLELIEQDNPSGGTDVFLLPGYAVDGYGRAIVVVNPLRLTVDLMSGLSSGPVPVWLRYDEGGARGVRPGFEVCGCSEYSRIAESYVLESGLRDAVVQRQSGITVAGESVEDAREALRVFDDNGGIVCDASIPFQNLPLGNEQKSVWLVPLGLVKWKLGVPGSFGKLTDDERLLSRRQRRYMGVVAETLLAADGLIRLRRREMPLDPAATTADACAADDVTDPSHDFDIQLCKGRPEFNELVWIEGRTRMTDDARLLASRLEFRDGAGTDYVDTGGQPGSVPLFFEREENGKNADLHLVLGKSKKGTNRFIIDQADMAQAKPDPDKCGRVKFDGVTPRVVFQDDGKIGVGTDAPDELLTLADATRAYLHVETTTGRHQIYVGADQDGAIVATLSSDDIRVRTGGLDPDDDKFTRVTVKPKGQVGIGTTSPDPSRLVTLEAQSGSYLIARTVASAGPPAVPPHEVMLGADATGAIVSATSNDDLQLRAGGDVTAVWIKPNGWVGLNTNSPDRHLTIEDHASAHVSTRMTGGASEMEMGVDSGGPAITVKTDEPLRLRTNGADRVYIAKDGNVGVGNDSPKQMLDVRGSIALGAASELFAPGATQDLRIVAGNVDAGGTTLFGTGFSVTLTSSFGMNQYVVAFDVAFSAPPVVLANSINGGPTSYAAVISVAKDQFVVAMDGGVGAEAFSFVVFGPRT